MTDERVRSVIAVTATLIAASLAALAWGDAAVLAVLALAITWLLWDRAELLDRCDQATDTADRALAHHTTTEPPPVERPDAFVDAYRRQLDLMHGAWRAGLDTR